MSIGASRSDLERGGKSSLWRLVLVASGLLAAAAQGKYGGGDGSAQAPYLIYTAEQMNIIGLHREDWDKHFQLMADIDLSAYKGDSFNLIGFFTRKSPQEIVPFSGVFDGNGHVLSNFTYVISKGEPAHTAKQWAIRDVGMFRYVWGENAEIKNLGLTDPNVGPARTFAGAVQNVGALVGRLYGGSITNCWVEGGRVSAHCNVGGLVGVAYEGTVSRCHVQCRVACSQAEVDRLADSDNGAGSALLVGFGGLIGGGKGATISQCWSAGIVQGHYGTGGLVGNLSSDAGLDIPQDLPPAVLVSCQSVAAVNGRDDVGGLIGKMDGKGRISDCSAAGAVSGRDYVGGLAGDVRNGVTVHASCARGSVSGRNTVGGLIGDNFLCKISDCYAICSVSGHSSVGGLTGRASEMSGVIENSYAAGRTVAVGQAGGLVGLKMARNPYDPGPYVVNSFWDAEATGQPESSGGGTGLTTAEMQSIWTYVLARWDFAGEIWNGVEDIWKGCGGRPMYPRLAWEASIAGDFVDPVGVDYRDLKALVENWLGTVDLPCQSGDLTLDTRVDFRDFAVLARWWRHGARKTIYETTLDDAPDWRADGQWQFGKPTGRGGSEHGNPDPTAGHTGENVYGVNLRGDYAITVDGPHYLTAGPFDCSRFEDVKLQFARWLNTDQADFVDATVEVSNDGKSWAIAWAYADTEAELMDEQWTVVTCDIGDKADYQQQVYIRWGYEVFDQEAWALSGWNIDDIVLSGCEARGTIPQTAADR